MRYRQGWVVWILLGSFPLAAQQLPEQSDIPEIEVIGNPVTESLLLQDSNQISLSADEVINLPGSGDDPLRALDNLPGINQSGDGVYMHGSSTRDNKLLVDQLSLPYLYHYGDTLSLINKDILAGYDVYPSGFAAVYGNRLGGVIDIKLRDPASQSGIQQRLHLGTYDASYFIEGAISEADSGYFSLRRSHLDLLLSGASVDGVDFIQFPKFIDSVGRWRHRLDNGEINTTFIASKDQLVFDLGEEAVDADKALIGRLESTQSFFTLGSQYRSQINDQYSHNTSLRYLQAYSQVKIGQQQAGDPEPGQPYHFDFTIKEYAFKPVLYWDIEENSELEIAFDSIRGRALISGYISAPSDERSDPGDTLTQSPKFQLDEDLDYIAIGGSISFSSQWSDVLNTRIGLRGETFRLYQRQIRAPGSPRLSASYQLSEDLKLTASYGIYYQAPQGYELAEPLGNPDLEYQRAEHRTLGLQARINDDWSAQMAIYQKPMSSLVVETGDQRNYNNQGSGEARGFDLFIKRRPADRKLDWISYSWSQSTRINHNTGLRRPFDGDQTHTLVWVHQQPFNGSWSDWQWGFKLKSHSGRPFTPVIAREARSLDPATDCQGDGATEGCYWSPIYAAQNSDRLPAYFNIDLSMNKAVKTAAHRYDLKLEILNASELIYQSIDEYEYGEDYENIDNPKQVSAGFGVLPAASFTLYF